MLRTLVSPAIELMNRLRFSAKLLLVSLLFSLPLGLLGYGYLAGVNEQLSRVDAEQQVLAQLPVLMALHRAYGDFQTEAFVARASDSRNQAALDRVTAAVNTALEQARSLSINLDALNQEWQQAQSAPMASVRDVTELNSIYDPTEVRIENSLRQLADSGGLVNDADIRRYYLADLLVKRSLALLKAQRRLRHLGAYALTLPTIDSTTYDVLSNELDRLYANAPSLRVSIEEVIDMHPQESRLRTAAEAALQSLQDSQALLQDELVEATDIAIEAGQFKARVDANLAQTSHLIDIAQQVLAEQLQAHRDELQRERWILLVLVLATLLAVAWLFIGFSYSLQITIASFQRALQRFADGDTTARAPLHTRDELSELQRSFNQMADHVHDLVQQVQQVAEQVISQSSAVTEMNESTAARSRQQQQQMSEIEQRIASVEHAAETQKTNASKVAESVQSSSHSSEQAQATVEVAVARSDALASELNAAQSVVEALTEQGKNINAIVAVIKTIAEQTNLLALNAAIEAARAGEQGRGFAVVADEVRTLATRTAQSTKEISQTINDLLNGIHQAVDVMQQSHQRAQMTKQDAQAIDQAIRALEAAMRAIDQDNQQNLSAADSQLAEVLSAQKAFQSAFAGSEQINAQMQQAVRASKEMAALAEALTRAIARFKV
ncbi:methyl-accepting chemotaxis protein [Permianibacter aggregans]|uniref:Methyl-accepting chemotaxis protein n=1 Tax=Permianibacter aggregans TaxID=1510150 RepID=A0A4R6UV55_9GAMM|nr:HAMP domain-containing methyl-accepting chemotaxis protein [Permianibacter aggregans]QGX39559.1 methyl-accepting chemotaxis protein [Permianibacter aggregans]TDQ49693.1 methyl-accepting chemotaxis protein [Permianibacter aggregans]